MIVIPNPDGVLAVKAPNVDQTNGAIASWINDSNVLSPSNHTWDKTAAAKLSINVYIPVGGDFDLLTLANTGGRGCWIWIDVNGNSKTFGPKGWGRTYHSSDAFIWSDGDNESTMTLGVGQHTINIYSLTYGMQIKAFALVPTGSTALEDGDTDTYLGGYCALNVLREDAEDGEVDPAWFNTGTSSVLTNVYDDDVNSRVMNQSTTTSLGSWWWLGDANNTTGWYDTESKLITWSHMATSSLLVYVRVYTTDGYKYMYYSASDTSSYGSGTSIQYGMGSDAADGTWRTYTRDLVADLALAQPTNELLAINAFIVRGAFRVDNIICGVYPPIAAQAEASEQSFGDWLVDESSDSSRTLLVELDHGGDTVRLASLPWLSDEHKPYDDWLIGDQFIEYSTSRLQDVGDIEAINPDHTTDWLNNTWRGYRARMYIGDVRWRKKSQFRLVATATLESVRPIGDRTYRFDLLSDLNRYTRTFHTGADAVETRTVEDAVPWLLDQFAGSNPVEFINILPLETEITLSFNVTESTTMLSVLQLIAASLNAVLRVQYGVLQFVKPDTRNPSVFSLDGANIIGDVRVVDVVNPAVNVVVTYDKGASSVTVATGAHTGTYTDSVIIETCLTTLLDAENLAAEIAPAYATVRNVWEMEIVGICNVLQIADRVTVNHAQLVGTGIINRDTRTHQFNIGKIEVTI